MAEEELRSKRLAAFGFSSCVATGPFIVSFFWHAVDGIQISDLIKEIPDIAFGGVAVAIAAFANTLFSFVKADGWRGVGPWTFWSAAALAACCLGCFLIYLRAADAPPAPDKLLTLFFGSVVFASATGIFALVMQFCFLSDECRPRSGAF